MRSTVFSEFQKLPCSTKIIFVSLKKKRKLKKAQIPFMIQWCVNDILFSLFLGQSSILSWGNVIQIVAAAEIMR